MEHVNLTLKTLLEAGDLTPDEVKLITAIQNHSKQRHQGGPPGFGSFMATLGFHVWGSRYHLPSNWILLERVRFPERLGVTPVARIYRAPNGHAVITGDIVYVSDLGVNPVHEAQTPPLTQWEQDFLTDLQNMNKRRHQGSDDEELIGVYLQDRGFRNEHSFRGQLTYIGDIRLPPTQTGAFPGHVPPGTRRPSGRGRVPFKVYRSRTGVVIHRDNGPWWVRDVLPDTSYNESSYGTR